MKKILWLCSWYPNKEEPLTGDFLERHAIAASLKNDITVLFVKRVANGSAEQVHRNYSGTLRSIVAYYSMGRLPSFLASGISFFRYLFIQKKLIDEYIRRNGKPHCIHVHICYKAGLGALYARMRYGIRYVVSEQWTIFCPEAKPGFKDQHIIARWLMAIIYRKASGTSAVSAFLASELSRRFNIAEPVRIPNVVDGTLFVPEPHHHAAFRFIHISTLGYQKSPEHIIEACRLLKVKSKLPFELVVFGPSRRLVGEMIREKKLDQEIRLMGEVPHDILAGELRKADVLLLYSRYETFGCVIIEAYASGVPVLVSNIPVMREIVKEGITGMLVDPENPEALASSMLYMMENRERFTTEKLVSFSRNFTYEQVASDFDRLYESLP